MKATPLWILLAVLLLSCDEEKFNKPLFETLEVSELTNDGVTCNGKFKLLGNHQITRYGFVIGTQELPDITSDAVHVLENKAAVGNFSLSVSDGIRTGITYYVRTFIELHGKILYSNTVKFVGLGSAPPVIHDFTPKAVGPSEIVTVTGDHLGGKDITTITVGDIPCIVISVNANMLSFMAPAAYESGDYPIHVSVADKSPTATPPNLTLKGPIVTSIEPTSGSAGTMVTIKGSNFSPAPNFNIVYFGDNLATVTAATATELKVTVPISSVAGPKAIRIESNKAKSYPTQVFTLNGPVITSFSPMSGIPGSEITITGTGFSSTASQNSVWLHGYTVEVISATATELLVKIPTFIQSTNSQIDASLTIAVSSIEFTAANHFLIKGPTLTAFDPIFQYEGRTLTLTGENFGGWGPVDVFFGQPRIPATILNSSSTSITLTIPYSVNSLANPCDVYVRVGSWERVVGSFNVLSPWTQAPSFPGVYRYGAVGFTIGDHSYYMAGVEPVGNIITGWLRRDVWRFDHVNETWTRLIDFPGEQRAFAFSFVINGKAYVGGGGVYSPGGTANIDKFDFWEYDPATDQWTRKADLPAIPSSTGRLYAATSIGAYGYCAINNALLKYDPSSNQWVALAMPSSIGRGAIATTIGDKAYFGLGRDNLSVLVFNSSSGTWSTLSAPFPNPSNSSVSFSLNGKLYVIAQDAAWVYDPVSGSWGRIPYLSASTFSNVAYSWGNLGFVFVGTSYGNNIAGRFYMLNPDY